MKPDNSQDALERTYYLPPQDSSLAQHWSSGQEQYTDLCQRGHNLIANAIIEGQKNGHPPTVEELYAIAGRVRRSIAWLKSPNHDKDQAFFYGAPNFTIGEDAPTTRLHDWIRGKNGHRFEHFYDAALQKAMALFAKDKDGTTKEAFGGEYKASFSKGDDSKVMMVSRAGHEIAMVVANPHLDEIIFKHVPPAHRKLCMLRPINTCRRCLRQTRPLARMLFGRKWARQALSSST